MNKIDKKLVSKIKWEQDPDNYDRRLYELGKGLDEFVVVNPDYDPWILDYLDPDAEPNPGCVVWAIDNLWLVKKFHKDWKPESGWKFIHCELDIDNTVEYNPAVKFINQRLKDIVENYSISIEDIAAEHVWYTAEKVWIARVRASDFNITGTKDMGVIKPQLEYNPDLPNVEWQITTPEFHHHDYRYELVWYLDSQFNPTDDNVWLARYVPDRPEGYKDMGHVGPKFVVNPDVPDGLDFYINDPVPYFDLVYEHVWMLDGSLHNENADIWAAKIVPLGESLGVKVIGNVKVATDDFDVIFISYNEPNAEANWQRVLEKAPNARRVKGVKGIFEAHKRAAELAQTKMFYVVDGDAELDDAWQFNFKVNVFDTDCVHLWTSVNPINGLEYGYGGVKLFPRQLLLDATTWNVDLTTGLGKLKLVNRISNITAFNYDEFTTWRSAFRECAKLSSGLKASGNKDTESKQRLKIWTTVGAEKPLGKFAIAGAKLGKKYGSDNYNNADQLKLINDYEWLRSKFEQEFGKSSK